MERTVGSGLSKWPYRVGYGPNRVNKSVSSRSKKIPAVVSRNFQRSSPLTGQAIGQRIIRYHLTAVQNVGMRIPRLGLPHAKLAVDKRQGGSQASVGREITPTLSCGDIGEVDLFAYDIDAYGFLVGLPPSEEIRLTGECNKTVRWLGELEPKMAQVCGQDSKIAQDVRQRKESLQREYDFMVERLHQIDAERPTSESGRAEIRRKRDDLLHNFSLVIVSSRNLWPVATTTTLDDLERRMLSASGEEVESLRESILAQIASIRQIEDRGDTALRPTLADNLLRFWPLWNALFAQLIS